MRATDLTVRYETRTCRCGAKFEVEIKRGRPQVWCDPCRESINAGARNKLRAAEIAALPPQDRPMTSDERVAYLEHLLRSRGTHISQHIKD